jgi:hypothetical protein
MPWFTCNVNRVGAAADGMETTQPVIYIMLTDTGGAFNTQWFFAAANCKSEMLAVALAAISSQSQVSVSCDVPPHPGGEPYTQCSRLYIIA